MSLEEAVEFCHRMISKGIFTKQQAEALSVLIVHASKREVTKQEVYDPARKGIKYEET